MNLGSAFTKAWQSFKGFIGKTDAFLQKNAPTIQQDVQVASAVASALVPAAAPIITIADTFEEALMGEVTAAFHTGAALTNTSDGTTAVTLSAELSAIVRHLADTLKGHPAVVTVAAAPAKTS
jgi:hypothetical protein